MAKTIATINLKNIHEIYLEIKNNYPKYVERFLYFLAACQYLDPDIVLEGTLKLRPYGGLIGIDNSSLDNYFKLFKILRLHAIIHDASGFKAEYSHKGPGYSYVLPCPLTDVYLGHIMWLAFCFFCEDVEKQFVHFAGMLKQELVILDFEVFRYKKTGFIIKKIKELALCSNNYSIQFIFSASFPQLTFL